MDSGTFGRGLIAFVQGLTVLVEDVKALMESEIYKQRLVRVLRQPRNKKALGDFLVLDNIYRGVNGLIGREDAAALWEVRERTFTTVRTVYIGSKPFDPDDKYQVGERWNLWKRLLHLRFEGSTPEGVWKEMGWE